VVVAIVDCGFLVGVPAAWRCWPLNRDPRRWDEAERFDVNRRAAGHFAFGAGIHLCVGQMLETEMIMTALAARVERIDILGEPRRKLSNSLRQFANLPVELIAAQ
jgi:4-methoxybenzoate monooxygenase (O-demethylating)